LGSFSFFFADHVHNLFNDISPGRGVGDLVDEFRTGINDIVELAGDRFYEGNNIVEFPEADNHIIEGDAEKYR
jgi:hypothetical protein